MATTPPPSPDGPTTTPSAPAAPIGRDDVFSITFGVIVSTVLAGAMVIAGLKAGITPGVSPLVILFAWGAFTKRVAGSGGTRFLNMAQVAGSAGMAVCAGVIFTAPIVQALYSTQGLPVPPVDLPALIIMSFSGALIGFGFVGLSTKKFLSDKSLPAPEARACETMIEAAAARPEARPNLPRSLYLAMAVGALVPLLAKMKAAKAALTTAIHRRGQELELGLPMDAMTIGIGALLTVSTALLVFAGAAIRLVGQWWMTGDTNAAGAPLTGGEISLAMRWVGGGAMAVAVAWSLVRFSGARLSGDQDADPRGLLEVPESTKRWLRASIVAGMAVLFAWLLWREGPTLFTGAMTVSVLLCAMLMVSLGALLSLQIGSSASPVSGTIFVTTLVLCGTGLAIGRHSIEDVLLLTPLLVAACVAVCTANDSSQDYKTLELCGVRVRDGYLAQFLGLLLACVSVPAALYVADQVYGFGPLDEGGLAAPQARMFATLFDAILINQQVPLSPVLAGLAVGAVAVAVEVLAKKRGLVLPSMALAVGIYLPADVGIAILIGAGFRFLADRGSPRRRGEAILAAAGLITGAALLELVLGVMIVGGFDEETIELAEAPGSTAWVVTALAILACGFVIWMNSKPAEER